MTHQDEKASHPTDNYTKSQLLHRGWTRAMVNKLLGPPDQTKTNPWHRLGAPMKLFAAPRVHAVESGVAFLARQAEADKRRAKLRQVFAAREQRLLELVASWDVTPERRALHDVRQKAIRHYDERHPDQPWGAARFAIDQDFIDRITVNFIRHGLTPYDRRLAELRGKVGVHAARRALRRRVYEAIAKTYPELCVECQRQAAERDVGPLFGDA